MKVDSATHKRVANLATELAFDLGDAEANGPHGGAHYYADLAFEIEDKILEALSRVEVQDFGSWQRQTENAEREHRLGVV